MCHHFAQLNEWTNTYDGIDLCAERVVTEIDEGEYSATVAVPESRTDCSRASEIERIAADGGRVERFSIVGYMTIC